MWKQWILTVVKKDWTEQAKMFLGFFAGFFVIQFMPASKLDDRGQRKLTDVLGDFLGLQFSRRKPGPQPFEDRPAHNIIEALTHYASGNMRKLPRRAAIPHQLTERR